MFLPDVALADANGIAERIRDRVSTAAISGALPVTISLGVAVVDPTDEPLEFAAALSAADRALFQAKSDGRNRTCVVTVERG